MAKWMVRERERERDGWLNGWLERQTDRENVYRKIIVTFTLLCWTSHVIDWFEARSLKPLGTHQLFLVLT